ncbi:MAG: T9SS type A sorting domain-containing protein [Flavobacteriaceae bacterium]
MKKITLLAAIFTAFSMNAQIFFDDFNTEVVDAITFDKWESIDQDGDGNFFEVFDAANVGDGVSSLFTGFGADSDSWNGDPLTPDNFLVTKDPIDLTNSSSTEISFLVGTYQVNGTFIDDKYSVYMTVSNQISDILAATPIDTRLVSDDVTASAGDGSDSAALVTIDASAFDGQVVYLSFRHFDSVDINSVLLDDITVDGILGLTDETFNGFNYFVDANNNLNLSANSSLESVQIFNVLGQQVVSQRLSNTNEIVEISSFDTGIYIVKVSIEGQTKTFKIIKK